MNRLTKWIKGKTQSEMKPSIEVTLQTAEGVTGTIRPLSRFEEELLSEVKALKRVLKLAACPNASENHGKSDDCKWCHRRKAALVRSAM